MSTLTPPAASLRLAVAVRYWHSARIVLESQIRPSEYMEPVGHLLSMSVELALKAYLQHTGTREKILRSNRVGHDLGKLLRRAVESGLIISRYDANGILVMRTAHLEHFHRYGPMDLSSGSYTIELADEQNSLSMVARLIDIISQDPNELRHMHQHPKDLEWPPTFPPLYAITLQELISDMREAEHRAQQIASIGAPHAFSSST